MDLARLAALFATDRPLPTSVPDDVDALQSAVGGTTAAGGLLRWFDTASAGAWQKLALDAFPALTGRVRCFAADWLGRQFALDASRLDERGQAQVLMLDVGAGELLEIPASLRAFHEAELVEYHDAALASTFYRDWRSASEDPVPLATTECVGYRVPLFLGGADDVGNLERTDVDVYWSLTGRMVRQVDT